MSPTRRMAVLSIATSIATLALKFGAWWLTGSIGLLSDALETLVNVAAGVFALYVLSIAEQPADEDHAFGHEKAEYFASGVEGLLILAAAAGIATEAVLRIRQPEPLTAIGPGIVLTIVATALNFATARIMLRAARRHDSIAVEADARHLLADVVTSCGVGVGIALIWAFPSALLLDPLIAIAVAAHIASTSVGLVRRSVDGLMDRSLPAEELQQLQDVIGRTLLPARRVVDLRTRRSGSRRFVEFKLRVPADLSVAKAHEECDVLETALEAALSRTSVVIHVEPLGDERS